MPATPLIPPTVEGEVKKVKSYSWDEVSKHNSLQDCWVVVEGKVYNVTQWVPQHPGGNIIGLAAGREATALVHSYHPPSVLTIIKKYYIGDLRNYENYYTFESKFYSTMKARVSSYLKQHHLSRSSWSMYGTSLMLLSLWGLFYYLSIIRGNLLLAVVFGFFHAQLGINIMHDGNHGAYSNNQTICTIAGFVMDLIGSSRVVWWHQHNVGHHPNSNNTQTEKSPETKLDPLAFDPDASAGNPFVRLNPSQPPRKLHQYQHIYMWFLIMFINFKWFINDIRSMVRRKYMDIDFAAKQKGELELLLVTKSIFLLYGLVTPVYLHGAFGILLFVTFMVATGYVFVLMFSVNHLTEECTFPDGELAYDKRDWAVLQVMTATNFANDSRFWTLVSGGLNFQIEHHLFPGINHVHLPKISPIVRQTCKEFGVPYNSFPSFWAAVYSYYAHLKNLGNPTPEEAKKFKAN